VAVAVGLAPRANGLEIGPGNARYAADIVAAAPAVTTLNPEGAPTTSYSIQVKARV
jgi:hypothetical protein